MLESMALTDPILRIWADRYGCCVRDLVATPATLGRTRVSIVDDFHILSTRSIQNREGFILYLGSTPVWYLVSIMYLTPDSNRTSDFSRLTCSHQSSAID